MRIFGLALLLHLILFDAWNVQSSDLNIEIPKKFRKTPEIASQFCNTCSLIGSKLRDILNDDSKYNSNEFELNLGFRLDSQGKKIRKSENSKKLVAMMLELHDICDNTINKDHFKIAKRSKTGYYYLISSDRVNEINKENERANNLENAKIMARVNAKYKNITNGDDFDWSDKMSRIPFEKAANDSQIEVTFEQKKEYFTKLMKFDYEREMAPKNYYNMKPKLVKKKKLQKEHSKMIKDMCYLISEAMDEWLHTFEMEPKDDEIDISNEIDFDRFCIDEMHGLCSNEMLDQSEELVKQKTERKMVHRIPDKPKPSNKPEPIVSDDYEEESEPDMDVSNELESSQTDAQLNENDVKEESQTVETEAQETKEKKDEL